MEQRWCGHGGDPPQHTKHSHESGRASEREGGREGEIEIKRCEESGHPDVNFELDVTCHNVVLCRVTRCLILASRNERFIPLIAFYVTGVNLCTIKRYLGHFWLTGACVLIQKRVNLTLC